MGHCKSNACAHGFVSTTERKDSGGGNESWWLEDRQNGRTCSGISLWSSRSPEGSVFHRALPRTTASAGAGGGPPAPQAYLQECRRGLLRNASCALPSDFWAFTHCSKMLWDSSAYAFHFSEKLALRRQCPPTELAMRMPILRHDFISM